MEKIKKENITKEKIIHEFYCDDCGECLMKSIECEDGWYPEPIKTEIYLYFDDNYTIEKYFCDTCREKSIKNLIKELEKLGFKKEEK